MVDVIYEDNQVLVCIKPQNIPSQADISGDEDMLTKCKQYIKQKYNKPGNVYLGLVHRLDRPTGGVMVFAKTSKAASRLSEQIKNKECTKKYVTVVCGAPQKHQDRLENYLQKNEKTNLVSIVPSHIFGAKKAELEYKVVAQNKNLSLIDINLLTGRSHQIRVQMAGIKTPVFGDSKYGAKIKNTNLALWAYNLTFMHPTLKQKMTFTVLPPQEQTPWNYFSEQLNNLK